MSDRFDHNPYQSPVSMSGDAERYGQIEGQPPLASLGDRLIGAIIDGIVVGIPAIVAGIVLGIILANIFAIDSIEFKVATFFLGIPIGLTLFIAIQGYLLAHYGQTVGKRLINTQIVSETNQLLTLQQLILKRYLPFWVLGSVPYIGGIFGLINVLAIFRSNRKCLHDDIAGTKVIKIV